MIKPLPQRLRVAHNGEVVAVAVHDDAEAEHNGQHDL